MATVRQYLLPEEALFLGTTFPAYDKVDGTNFPVSRLLYDASSTERAYWKLEAFAYGSGDITVDLIWYAVSATNNTVRWEVALAAVTPESDSQDVESKAFDTAVTGDDTHLGTTAHRLMKATITLVDPDNIDGIAAGDEVWLRISRLGGATQDNLSGDAALTSVRLSYSDS